jgi:hypothetical protein
VFSSKKSNKNPSPNPNHNPNSKSNLLPITTKPLPIKYKNSPLPSTQTNSKKLCNSQSNNPLMAWKIKINSFNVLKDAAENSIERPSKNTLKPAN